MQELDWVASNVHGDEIIAPSLLADLHYHERERYSLIIIIFFFYNFSSVNSLSNTYVRTDASFK